MTNFARVINDIAVDVSTNPGEEFHAILAAQFVPVPDEVQNGWQRDEAGEWSAPTRPVPTDIPEPEPTLAKLSPVEFKMAFTIAERAAIADIRADAAAENKANKQVLDLWYEVLDDPRLSFVDLGLLSIQEGLNFLEAIGVLTAERKAAILATKPAE